MARSAGVWLALGLTLLPPALADDGHGGSAQGVTVQTLVRSDRSWDGARLPPLDAAQPEVSVLRITVPPGVRLQRHLHPVINAGVLLQGRLRVEGDNGATLLLEPGQALIEVVNTVHRGVSLGPDPAVIVVVYVGPKGQPTTLPVAP
ncbi:MAG: cupin domain-containing protein [Cyanobium sp. LacPavin_0818_WC50_MAG_67_9]|nr:cupin domain-containing protein [Cyanobium sp. LacPavin_0818_WC50_MAG_67_9]